MLLVKGNSHSMRRLDDDNAAVYSKSNNGTTINAFIDDNGDGENDLGEKIISYRIDS